ncbi:MAG: right-handed parallel beta-helix repeat-containing protein, partial [Gammaproteobacteria bacterium]|nr:right-handed parallel beta-helix repeat-containing protein [Gammaproteobacteria bacterium]
MIYTFDTTDSTYPQYSLNQTDSTGAGTDVLFSLYWTDNDLAGYVFSFDNGTGTFSNDSYVGMTGTGNWSNVSKWVNSTIGSTIRWQVYANDSAGNMNGSLIYSFDTIDLPLTITIDHPGNDTYDTTTIWFNVTLNKPGDWCAYSLDGAPNTTMEGSATEWYKQNTSMTEGSHNVTFSCNDTEGNMNHTMTRTFTIDLPIPCSTLSTPDTIYTLTGNVSSAGTCFTIGVNNITLDCDGYTINYSGLSVGYAVNNTGYDNLIVRNCNILQSGANSHSYAIYVKDSENSTINNNTIKTSVNWGYGVYFVSSNTCSISDNTIDTSAPTGFAIALSLVSSNTNIISNNIITTAGGGGYGILLSSFSNFNNLSNNIITTTDSNSYGIFISSSSNNRIYDTDISATDDFDIYLAGSNEYINYIINSTFNPYDVGFGTGATDKLEVQWYLDIYVNDTVGNSIPNANVTAWQNNGSQAFTNQTNAQGNIERQILTEYMQNETGKYYDDYVNYTVNATLTGYSEESKQLKLTQTIQTYFTLTDSTSAQYSQNQTNSTFAGKDILFSLYWTDNDLAGYVFSFDNGTGTFSNDSYVGMTGTGNWSNVSKWVNSTVGSTIRWQVYANDSAGNMNASLIYSFDTTDDADSTYPQYSLNQ